MRAILHVFRCSPLKVVFVHPLMQPLPCPVAQNNLSTIVVLDTRMRLGELWCLSILFLQGRAAQNVRYAVCLPFFSLKGRFSTSVDAAPALPHSTSQSKYHCCSCKSRMSLGRVLVPFYPILARSGCSKMLAMLHIFLFSPLKVVFAHPLMQLRALPHNTSQSKYHCCY